MLIIKVENVYKMLISIFLHIYYFFKKIQMYNTQIPEYNSQRPGCKILRNHGLFSQTMILYNVITQIYSQTGYYLLVEVRSKCQRKFNNTLVVLNIPSINRYLFFFSDFGNHFHHVHCSLYNCLVTQHSS